MFDNIYKNLCFIISHKIKCSILENVKNILFSLRNVKWKLIQQKSLLVPIKVCKNPNKLAYRNVETMDRRRPMLQLAIWSSPQTELFFYVHQCRMQTPNMIVLKDAYIETHRQLEDRFQGDIEIGQNLRQTIYIWWTLRSRSDRNV